MKMLLRCPKNKPYVEMSPLNMYPDLYGAFDEQYEFEDLNGKIVAECDFEVEEHKETTIDWLCMSLREKIIFGNMCEKANIDELNCYEYANGKPLYAIHIKNLHIFDNPKELNEFRKGKWVKRREGPVYWVEEEIKRAPSNMIHVVDEKGKDYVLLTVMHEPLCEILNGHQTIIIRKSILEEMKR